MGAEVMDARRYLFHRTLDTLLREDVGGCVSRARFSPLPPRGAPVSGSGEARGGWLMVEAGGEVERVWLPVLPSEHMQDWRFDSSRPVLAERGGTFLFVEEPAELVRWLLPPETPDEETCLREFAFEYRTALEHRLRCEAELERLFATGGGSPPARWWEQLLHHDRLASFLDHPYYPTARAKVGFGLGDLERFAPEFQPVFLLRWMALPRALLPVHGQTRPAWWPRFEDVGLPVALEDSHTLLPVHPHTWETLWDDPALAELLSVAVRAPKPRVEVTPTLSVRTVVVLAEPHWHLKLPLRIRTLGMRNLRTMKPSTLVDGHTVQSMLGQLLEGEPGLRGRVLLTNEEYGGAVEGQPLLGFLARRYPEALTDEAIVSVAGLAASGPDGRRVMRALADDFYAGDVRRLFEEYVALTLELHLRLWVRYGIALESNQQNSMLVLSRREPHLRLLLKDNDAPRIWPERLGRHARFASVPGQLKDRRILCEDEDALARMFLTITLQLNLSAPLEGMAARGVLDRDEAYALVRSRAEQVLGTLEREGEDISAARRWLLETERHPVKYLLTAATLRPKSLT
ncbi:MAG TPA: IucA/IucC family protein, partial [Archangium sp.]|nr:IucA/IucC family protein [Archangium sp.]